MSVDLLRVAPVPHTLVDPGTISVAPLEASAGA
jgi:hypothetical protein